MNWTAIQALIETVGWTLVHFLWQGVALAVLFAICRTASARAGSLLRYRLLLGIFLATGLAPVLTFLYLWEPGASGATGYLATAAATVAADGAPAEALAWWVGVEQMLQPYLPWLVAGWLAGVSIMSGRVCMDWWQVRRLTRTGVRPLSPEWESRVAALVRDFGVSRPVRVLRSTIVRVPAVIGWLRPVILVPTAALAGLSPRQLELVIAHELVHIQRSDYLVNLMQVIIETLLFYHPVVAWMSNHLREEREHCCDDAVIGTCGDTLTYAHALTELEAQRQLSYQTALAASGGRLSARIYRLLDRQAPRRGALIWSLSLVVGLAAASMAVATQLAMQGTTQPVTSGERNGPALATLAVPAPATPGADLADAQDRDMDASAETSALAGQVETAGVAPDRPGTPAPARSQPAAAEQTVAEEPEENAGTIRADAAAPQRQESSGANNRPQPRPGNADAEPAERAPENSGAGEAGSGMARPEPTRVAMASRPDEGAAERPRPELRGGRALTAAAPTYPRRARLRGLEGSVTAEFTIDRDGRIDDIRIVESSPAGVFDHAVESALSKWRFEPLYRDGEVVSRRVAKVFEFNLSSGTAASRSQDNCDPMTGTRICRPWTDSERLNDLEELRAR